MRNTLICTVGTSLSGNLNNLDKDRTIDESTRNAFKNAFKLQNWQQVSLLLLKQNNSSRICGAEINSITSICNEKLLTSTERLIFLISDTEDGKKMGEVLKLYYQNSKNQIRFKDVEIRVLKGLRDDSVKDFQQQGLKNLVVEISKEARKFSPDLIAINATGGYKAQISFAGMIGQALSIPVYYLFEKFSKVIELPPQPVSLDLGLWLDHYGLFADLEMNQQMSKTAVEHDAAHANLQSMLEEEPIDGELYITLSAMGQLFHERCRLQFAKQETTILSLIPQDATEPQRKPISIRDDHGKDILEAFAKKLCRSPYVKSIVNSLPFNSRRTDPIRRIEPDGIVDFVLTWTDAGYGLCVQTTGRNMAETTSIALHLVEKFKE